MAKMTKADAVAALEAFYQKSKLPGLFAKYEPDWRPAPFDALAGMDEADVVGLAGLIGRKTQAKSSLLVRYFEDGLMVGSSTWVFMHRAASAQSGLFKISPVLPTLVANGRQDPQGNVWWAIWCTDDGGYVLRDRNPGTEKDIDEILNSPAEFGLPAHIEFQ